MFHVGLQHKRFETRMWSLMHDEFWCFHFQFWSAFCSSWIQIVYELNVVVTLYSVKRLQESCDTWRVQDVCGFCSGSDLIRSSMSHLLCQWLCVWEPSKGWECLTFFGGACLGWESFSSPDSVFFPKSSYLQFFPWALIQSLCVSSETDHPPCASQYCAPVCLLLFLHAHSAPFPT